MSKELTAKLDIFLNWVYKRTDVPTNPNNLKDETRFEYNGEFTDGEGGTLKAEVLWHDQLTVDAGDIAKVEFDSLTDNFGDTVDLDVVKRMVVRNRNTETGFVRCSLTAKNEEFPLGPNGAYVMEEPRGEGIELSESEESGFEGDLEIVNTSPERIKIDVLLIGSSVATSSGA